MKRTPAARPCSMISRSTSTSFSRRRLGRLSAGFRKPRAEDPRRFDPPAAAGAMLLAFAQKMILQVPERRLDVVPTPAAKAKLPPVVVIGGLAAHRDHGVDGG